jgi:geranylgeranyl pyrophosphate synthase
MIPSQDAAPTRQLISKLIAVPPSPLQADLKQALEEPARSMLERGGKMMRPLFIKTVASMYGVEGRNVEVVAACVEVLHAGSLVIDDIEDGSLMRRGLPCVHKLFPVPIAINAGCYMFFKGIDGLLNQL